MLIHMVLHLMRIKVNGDVSSPYAVFCRCLGVSAATEVFALFAKEPKYKNTFSIFVMHDITYLLNQKSLPLFLARFICFNLSQILQRLDISF